MIFSISCKCFNFFFLLCLSGLSIAHSGRVRRIVNGNVVEAGLYPIVISIRSANDSKHMCGGTLISQTDVLTAAHCIEQSFGRFNVQKYIIKFQNLLPEGGNDLSHDEQNLNVGVERIFVHDEYSNRTSYHDIAIMRINKSITTMDNYFTNILPQTAFGLTGDCQVFGYGKTTYDTADTSYDTLRAGEVSIISGAECEDLLTEYVAPKVGSGMMCATGKQADACQGDSGSPMICSGTLEGVVSYGMGCLGSAGVYTRVAEHMDWIQAVLNN